MKEPMISVVVVTHNSENVIIDALSSIYMQEPGASDVVVVDNGSMDATVELIRGRFPQVLLVVNDANEGACKARNQGIALSKAEWVLTLDCDTVLGAGFMRHIRRAIDDVPDNVGMIQPKIMMPDRITVYSLGIRLDWMRRFFDVGRGRPDSRRRGRQPIIGPCAAAAVYRRRMLGELQEETGYFDERFFFLVEDVDLAWRAYRRGWKAVVYPGALCYHNGNSSGASKQLRQYLCFRNRMYSIAKNEGAAAYGLKVIPVVCYDFPRLLYLVFSNAHVRDAIAARLVNK